MAEVSFGEWLKRRRKTKGLTHEEIARQINCNVSALRKFEAERRRPSEQIIELLAETLNIPSNERGQFVKFARGDWNGEPGETKEHAPWLISTVSTQSNLSETVTSLVGAKRKMLKLVPTCLIIQALGYIEAKNQRANQQLKENIGDIKMRLVLDNGEHLIEDVASIASGLLSACSRLGMAGELGLALAMLALHRNNYPLARQYFMDFLKVTWTSPNKQRTRNFLPGMAAVAAGTNQSERAGRSCGAWQTLLETTHYRILPFDQAEFDRHVCWAREQLGEEALESLIAEGSTLIIKQAIAIALEQSDG